MLSAHHRLLRGSIGALALTLSLVLSGCTSWQKVSVSTRLPRVVVPEREAQVVRRGSWRIDSASRWYFAYPELRNREAAMPRLSHQLAVGLRQKAQARLEGAEVAPPSTSPAQARALASLENYDFFIIVQSDAAQQSTQDADLYRLDQHGNLAGGSNPVLYAQIFDLRSGRLLDTVSIRTTRRSGWDAPAMDTDAAVEALLSALIRPGVP